MGKIVILLGTSNSGKDTIYKELLKDNKFNLKKINICTTRPKRSDEIQGKEYYFCSQKEMEQLQQEKRILEIRPYETSAGIWHYFTVKDNIDLTKYNYLTINTLAGLKQYYSYFDKEDIISIFLQVDDYLKLKRAIRREQVGEKPNYVEMCRRFIADKNDFSIENLDAANISTIIENNGEIKEAVREINKFLQKKL